MCGRFASTTKPEDLVELFGVEQWDPTETIAPSWNVAPTDSAYAVLERTPKGLPDPVRQLRVLRWGLVPAWSKSPESAVKMINARADTVHEKPSYRQAFASRRCLLPIDGYYEWETIPVPGRAKPRKQPYFVSRTDGGVLALAGLYEFWRDRTRPADDALGWLVTCTIVTTEAEPLLAPIHERMPLFLDPGAYDAWLDPGRTDPDELRSLLVAPAPGALRAVPVGAAVGNIRNNSPDLLRPLTDAERNFGGAGGGTTLF
ncbi:SOS response-associated peptidase [Kitasatospora sp. MAP5-34]|uniref:SOS response-associated peptidase n=1 Tax=Kitasatospora sp. MAP5-34 TaxID=3035102 RepID=UPI002473FB63|nr:SOS response-associated peptidase [Kitasatospora sp. MAP5-34]MDH6575579.1 putative SOS response-associated peptidase YedK [Kitasatospora sp. MAP5-34]